MKPDAFRHILRGLLILVVQVLILKRMADGNSWIWLHGNIFIYPVIILLLPIRMARHYVILIGFAVGLLIDMFYDTVGVHAFALTAVAYARGLLLNYLEPRGGYTTVMTPTQRSMGMNWLLIYTSILYAILCFLYFTVEIFTFVYIGQILLKTVITFLLSMMVVMGYHMLFNPRA
jgi:hypothetical protein